MQFPEFTPDGGYSLIVRPEPVIYSPRPKPARQGFFQRCFMSKKTKLLLAAVVSSVAFSTGANAAIAAGVSTAMSDAVTDVGTLGALALLIVVAVATFRYLKRAS